MGTISNPKNTITLTISVLFALPALLAGVAFAQVAPDAGMETPVDAYGNARPLYRERRDIGLFQNEVQREALRGYQDLARRENRRGGEFPFALAGDFSPRFRNLAPIDPLHGGVLPFTTRKAYERYGGFGQRAGRATEGDLGTILGRRQAILTATSGTAPVQRSLWQYGVGAVLADPRRDFPPSAPAGEGTPAVAATLTEKLNQTSREMARELRAYARKQFQGGDFRLAAQSFESAYTVTPSDFDSRVREIFCHLALGSMRTARVLLQALLRRDSNPFDQQVDLAAEIGNLGVAREIRVRTSMVAQVNESTDAAALHAFTLWYLGDREESTLVAEDISGSDPGSDYAGWPEKMRAAKARDTGAGAAAQ